jgi:hypothetical protein
MVDANFRNGGLLRKAIVGVILGAIVGGVVMWFFEYDITHFWASVVTGALYMTALPVLTDCLQLAGGRILLGAVSGLLAAIVWWAIAVRTADAFVLAAIAGICFGSAYAWSEARKGR